MELTEIGKESFAEVVLNSDIPVLAEYRSPRCGSCHIMNRMLEELAPNYSTQLKMVSIDVEENDDLAVQYQVMSIPTLKLFKNGREVETLVGAKAKHEVTAFLDRHI